jgi:hypothetical protein
MASEVLRYPFHDRRILDARDHLAPQRRLNWFNELRERVAR